jgi:hypothetical protein
MVRWIRIHRRQLLLGLLLLVMLGLSASLRHLVGSYFEFRWRFGMPTVTGSAALDLALIGLVWLLPVVLVSGTLVRSITRDGETGRDGLVEIAISVLTVLCATLLIVGVLLDRMVSALSQNL